MQLFLGVFIMIYSVGGLIFLFNVLDGAYPTGKVKVTIKVIIIGLLSGPMSWLFLSIGLLIWLLYKLQNKAIDWVQK